ncbi:nitroreductase family protein [Ammoniphilus resinae]|uniref:Putative NAD(P)H nitroreductase n=1 Tax=Ammoniphilus resinae TaxID=861532 RepID=A0ABS4GSA1_9BACL|nr:nitroreductase [Ammoniphilus resinae]MBP1933126.1 nitroreductase [Ammoniphilus resinae]
MDVIDAIKSRRSIGKVKRDPVSIELVEKVLEAATWAPCHHLTEPWRFFVMTGDGRKLLGKTLGKIAEEGMEDLTTVENQEKIRKQEEKALRAPVIIAVAVTPSDNPRVERIEEFAAVNAAIQNMLLTAHALGLGAVWRTGKPAYHPKMKELFSLRDEDEVLGFVYMGYPDIEPPVRHRKPFAEKTIWMDSN